MKRNNEASGPRQWAGLLKWNESEQNARFVREETTIGHLKHTRRLAEAACSESVCGRFSWQCDARITFSEYAQNSFRQKFFPMDSLLRVPLAHTKLTTFETCQSSRSAARRFRKASDETGRSLFRTHKARTFEDLRSSLKKPFQERVAGENLHPKFKFRFFFVYNVYKQRWKRMRVGQCLPELIKRKTLHCSARTAAVQRPPLTRLSAA